MIEKATELAGGVEELVELAEDGWREVEWIVDLLAIPDESLNGLRAAIFLDADRMAPSEQFEEYRESFERLCESMPHVSRECLKMLGLSCASISFFSDNLKKANSALEMEHSI